MFNVLLINHFFLKKKDRYYLKIRYIIVNFMAMIQSAILVQDIVFSPFMFFFNLVVNCSGNMDIFVKIYMNHIIPKAFLENLSKNLSRNSFRHMPLHQVNPFSHFVEI